MARVGAVKGAAIGAVIGTVGLAVAQHRSTCLGEHRPQATLRTRLISHAQSRHVCDCTGALIRGLSIPFKGFLLTGTRGAVAQTCSAHVRC